MPYVQPRPNPALALQTDAPQKEALLPGVDPVVPDPAIAFGAPLVPRNYESRIATDADCYAAMFMAIESQRVEVGSRMDEYGWNNDMARAIEKLKNEVQMVIDKMQGEDPGKTIMLPPEVARFIWDNDIPIDGVSPRNKYPSFEAFSTQQYSAAQLRTVVSALDIEKSKYTDMNTQYMQQMQISLGLLQVFQQLLTSLIDSIKRVKESISSKI